MKYGELLARKMVWLAYQASSPTGLGNLQYREDITEETLWSSADVAKLTKAEPISSWTERIGVLCGKGRPSTTYVSCDYVFGRMMKLKFSFTDSDVVVDYDYPVSCDYQSWASSYQSMQQLRHAAIHELYVENL